MRFLGAQIIVVVVGLIVAAVVTALVGPPTFAEHFRMIGHNPMAQDSVHARQAYHEASLITLAVTVPAALVAAAAVSWWMSGRLRASLKGMEQAAAAVADGSYDVRVAPAHFGSEVDALGRAFNTMARRLENTEETRRKMLSDLAHEMATPVSVLGVYLDGLDDGVVEWNSQTRGILDQQLSRLTRLIQDLDDVSRAQEGRLDIKPEVQELGPLLARAVRVHAPEYAAKGVDLVLAEDSAFFVNVDTARFGQVMDNLLVNALRHTDRGGSVTVSVNRRALQSGNAIAIDVTDTGEGMTELALTHVFERFYRAERATDGDGFHTGSGLGLTISRALVEAHGGKLTATSPGKDLGATFTVELPVA